MITGIDHLVLTVRDIEASVAFYSKTLSLEAISFGQGRRALQAGAQKINLQRLGQETRNHASIGSGDLCLETDAPLETILARLDAAQVPVIEGPVAKNGARGPMQSVYFNDPDGNLVEICRYDI